MSRKINLILGAVIKEYPNLSIDDIKEIIIDYINDHIDEIILDYIDEHIKDLSQTKSERTKLIPIGTKGFRKEILYRKYSSRESKNALSDIFDTYIYELTNRKKFNDANIITEHKANIDAAYTFIDETLQHTDIHAAKLQEEDIKTDNNKTITNIYNIGVNNMRDINIAGQAGAQGSGAYAHDMKFDQIWSQNDIDLPKLAMELAKFRSKLKGEAIEPEHDVAIGVIASAESFAREGNGSKAIEYLAKAGKWAYGKANEYPLVFEILKKTIGL